jgi:hypothetical protein
MVTPPAIPACASAHSCTAFATAERLDVALTAHQIRHTFFAMDGFHNYVFWRRCFEEAAPLLFR